jgi:hypothetical protein
MNSKKTKVEGMPNKPLPCDDLIDVLKEKLKTQKKGIIRKWIKCKIKELTR